MSLLEVRNLKKVYTSRLKTAKKVALDGLSFTMENGEFVVIMGESGSGKTTLLNILAMLDRPTEGSVLLNGTDIVTFRDDEASKFRREKLGYVFQDFNLLDTLSIKDNIMLPLVLAGESYVTIEAKLAPIAKLLGIDRLLERYPYEVSGGEKQRAAVARALITEPEIVLADEPTGALDSNSSDDLMRHMREINSAGQSILMVTHSVKAASNAGRILFIKDGKIFHEIISAGRSAQVMYMEISNTLTMLAKEAE